MSLRTTFIVSATAVVAFFGAPVAQAGPEIWLGIDTTGSVLYEIDPTDGSTTFRANVSGGATIGALAYDAANDVLYASSTSLHELYTLDYDTGQTTLVGGYGLGSAFMHGLEYANGTLYGTDFATNSLYTINVGNGDATFVGATGRSGFGSMGYDPTTGTMYYGDTDADALYTIDLGDGSTSLVGSYGQAGQIGIAMSFGVFGSHSGMLAMNNSGTDNLWSLDLGDGSATLIGDTGSSNIISLAFIGQIPGPGALGLLAVAAIGRRRRRR